VLEWLEAEKKENVSELRLAAVYGISEGSAYSSPLGEGGKEKERRTPSGETKKH